MSIEINVLFEEGFTKLRDRLFITHVEFLHLCQGSSVRIRVRMSGKVRVRVSVRVELVEILV